GRAIWAAPPAHRGGGTVAARRAADLQHQALDAHPLEQADRQSEQRPLRRHWAFGGGDRALTDGTTGFLAGNAGGLPGDPGGGDRAGPWTLWPLAPDHPFAS